MTPEQKQRIEQIQNGDQPWRKTAYELGDVIAGHETDVDFLLSLVKSQEAVSDDERLDAMLKKSGILHTCHRPHDAGTALERLARNISDLTATSMRSACVEKVKAMRDEWQAKADARRDPDNPHEYKGSYGLAVGAVDACDDIVTALESISIQEQEPHDHDWYNDGNVLRCYDCTDTQPNP